VSTASVALVFKWTVDHGQEGVTEVSRGMTHVDRWWHDGRGGDRSEGVNIQEKDDTNLTETVCGESVSISLSGWENIELFDESRDSGEATTEASEEAIEDSL
jgi:hypothetical protein